jgi:aminoglycoside phosphotransferase (APT) family kinase protein
VRLLLEPGDSLGDGFVMDRIDGETIPRRILRDEHFASARELLTAQCGEQAARIHAVAPEALPNLPVCGPEALLDQYRGLLDSLGEPHPAFELGLRHLMEQPPAPTEPHLVHGDFRNGNFVVGPDGLRAVLDWEMTHLGDPVEDLGWLCVKSWRFGMTDRRAGGFGDVETLLDSYVAAGGAPVDPDRLRWWETFGTLKWGLICGLQAHTHLGGLVRSVELATLGRRIAEMEWDLLELLTDTDHDTDRGARAASDPEVVTGTGDPRPHAGLQDRPSAAELLEAVREFLQRDLSPDLEGRAAFHARVAVNALGIVERELVLGPRVDAPALARVRAVIGRDGAPRELVDALARGIRDRTLDDRDPAVLDAVRAVVRAKLEVANPRYLEA